MNNPAKTTTWTIAFSDLDGEVRTTEILWTETEPTRTEVAGEIRDRLLQGVLFQPGQKRESSQHTEALLEHHGYTIVGVKKV